MAASRPSIASVCATNATHFAYWPLGSTSVAVALALTTMRHAAARWMRRLTGREAVPSARTRLTFYIAACAITFCLGCSPTTQVTPPLQGVAPRPLPFRGKIVSENQQHLPSAVAQSRDESSAITFQYRETVKDEHNPVPVLVSLLNPFVLFGCPLGSYTTMATGDLKISQGEAVLASYSAQARVTGSYGLYYGSTFPQLEREARRAVEQSIDESLYRDADRLGSQKGAVEKSAGQIERTDQ